MRNGFLYLETMTDVFGNSISGWEARYDPDQKKWVDSEGSIDRNWIACRSLRAALRHLRKHDEIPKGVKFVLGSRYVGYDRILTKR